MFFLSVGSDNEAESDLLLIAGTNRDLAQRVADGTFADDLLACLNLWTFRLPGLAERHEGIEPNLDFELERFECNRIQRVTFNCEARRRFLDFAKSGEARWQGNFRDLSASITRITTLCAAGRIQQPMVEEDVRRLSQYWQPQHSDGDGDGDGGF
jgi:transcriptional regulatory protein RtcR